jgi:hypothetical protein
VHQPLKKRWAVGEFLLPKASECMVPISKLGADEDANTNPLKPGELRLQGRFRTALLAMEDIKVRP